MILQTRLWIIIVLFIGSTQCFLLYDKWRCPYQSQYRNHVFPYKGYCYEFVLGDGQYWDVADKDCNSRGAHLVVIHDEQTQQFLMRTLQALLYTGKTLWIGLSDARTERVWRWVTGERLSGYSNWKSGENKAGVLHSLQDCVSMEYSDSGLWYDVTCHVWPAYYDYICQYEMVPTTTRSTTTTRRTTTTTTTTTITTTPINTTPSTTTSRVPPSSSTTTPTQATTVGCAEVNCMKTCPNGYYGLSVGLDGCIQCQCR